MTTTWNPNQLLSRIIRTNASNGITGAGILTGSGSGSGSPRSLDLFSRFQIQTDPQTGGFLDSLWDAASSLVGFISQLVGAVGFSVARAFDWLRDRIEQLKSFDWNATDEELRTLASSQNIAVAAAWGSAVGQGLGTLGGIAIGYGVGLVCPVVGGSLLAGKIAEEITNDALPGILGSVGQAINQTVIAAANTASINAYIAYRNALRNAPRALLESVYGAEQADFIQQQWGGEGGPTMTFNKNMDERVEALGGEALVAFMENLLDEAWDNFIEAGFIIAHEIDDAFTQARAAKRVEEGPPKTIELTTDINAPREKLTFEGIPQRELQRTIQTTINTNRQIWNRDVAEIVGMPYEEHLRARPQMRKLQILFREVETPPWRLEDGSRGKEAVYSIPDVKRSLTWQEIKLAAKPYTWGRFCARAILDNQRQMAVYGASAEEARNQLLSLHSLSDSTILKLTVSEEEIFPNQLRKDPKQLYSVWATFMARFNSLDEAGRTTLDGRTYDEITYRIPLWFEPDEFEPL